MNDSSQTPAGRDDSNQRLGELERRLEEKESQLRERDQTVQELTARLSQAVERLDRVQRVGTDRIVLNSASFSKEVVEQQTELVGELQRSVELWDNMLLACNLGRLEMQLSDLRDLFEEHFREPEPEPLPTESAQEDPAQTFSEAGASADPEVASDLSQTEEPQAEAEHAEPDDLFLVGDVCPMRPPEILNLAEAKESSLRLGVEHQDAYIDYLSARLQRAAANPKSVDWDELASQPERLQQHLQHIATKLQQSRQFAEFEVTLQRTRLTRKERDLKLVSDELARQMQSLGPAPEPDSGKETPGGRRWMRMLGMGKAESD